MVSDFLKVQLKTHAGSFLLDVDFSCQEGLTVLFGPSGSGKSTILNCLAGLKRVDEGRIIVSDKTLLDTKNGINLSPQKRRVAYVFQNPALFPHLSVEENIAFAINDWAPAERSGRIQELVQLLKLEGLNARRTSELSGGQIQRVALARALAPRPELILLDEPLSAIDAAMRTELAEELKSLQKSLSVPMVFVTHSKAECFQLADAVVLVESGRVTTSGKAHEVLSDSSKTIGPEARFSF